jgi:hypothetical protein
MSTPSRRSIFAALAGNVAVGVVKLLAYFLSGSSSMLVESIHSAIDTLNQGLLLIGQRRGARPPEPDKGVPQSKSAAAPVVAHRAFRKLSNSAFTPSFRAVAAFQHQPTH